MERSHIEAKLNTNFEEELRIINPHIDYLEEQFFTMLESYESGDLSFNQFKKYIDGCGHLTAKAVGEDTFSYLIKATEAD